MDPLEEEGFGHRLVPVFKKLLQSSNMNDTYMDKILTTCDDELRAHHTENISAVYEWLSGIIHSWNETEINLSEADFLCRLIGLLSNYDEIFRILCTKNILNDLINALKDYVLKHNTLKIIFIKMFSAIAGHNSGCIWISTSQVWEVVVNIYFSSANLYVEREGILFFKKLLSATTSDESINESILEYIFLSMAEALTNIGKDKKLNSNILLFLKLLEVILKNNIFSYNSNFHLKLEKLCNIEVFLKNLIENSEQETIKEAALVSLVLFAILKFENKENLLPAEDLPCVLDVFNMLLLQNQFVHIIKLSKYCQTFWNDMRHQMNCPNTSGGNFILVQLLPSLMCINMPADNTQYELYMKKLFTGKSTKFQKFLNSLGKAVKSDCSSNQKDLPVKGILSVIANFDCFSLEEGVLILQAMIFIIMSLIFESGHDLETSAKKFKNLGSSGIQDKPLLSGILNGVSGILKKFKINWTDLETFGLFKITNTLLKISNLPSLVVVQTLQVVKAAILNCISPDVASSNIQTNFETLLPLLYERMTDSSWEIRDSCLEVVIATVELSESKYPDFQQILLIRDFRSLLLDIVENDTESYVRASALRALIPMTKIERLNPFLNDQDSCIKITKLVETESEGIVRREAALLVKEIYLSLNNRYNDLINMFYRVMSIAAICDLHWEVKINSLIFWEAVIQRIISEEAKLQKPSLNKDDVTQGLNKSLKKLSKIGCLHILLTILKDDCDMIVIKKSAEVLSNLLGILQQYNANLIQPDMSSCNAACRKRKNSDLTECDSKMPSISGDSDLFQESVSSNGKPLTTSEKVIEDIVNDTDFNLLRNVSPQNDETDKCQKSVFLQEIEPELFLKQMEGFDKDKFLENKQKWFTNVETDLTETLNEINIEHSVNEINIMDCY